MNLLQKKKKLGKLSIDFLSKVNDLQVMLDGENEIKKVIIIMKNGPFGY